MSDDEAMESKNAPLFLVSKAVCHSSGAGCGCDPCLRLAIGERACLCVGSGDDCCCRRHNHAGAFSFSRYGLIARREKPLPTRAPSGVRLLVAVPHANILSRDPQHPRRGHPRIGAVPRQGLGPARLAGPAVTKEPLNSLHVSGGFFAVRCSAALFDPHSSGRRPRQDLGRQRQCIPLSRIALR